MIPIVFVYIIIHTIIFAITGFSLLSICSACTITFMVVAGWQGYELYQSITSIQKDLRQKTYVPVIAVISQCIQEKQTDSEGSITWSYYLKLDIDQRKILLRTTDFAQSTTKIRVTETVYQQQKKDKKLFFIVSKHSNYWFCTDETFQPVELGCDFFNKL